MAEILQKVKKKFTNQLKVSMGMSEIEITSQWRKSETKEKLEKYLNHELISFKLIFQGYLFFL